MADVTRRIANWDVKFNVERVKSVPDEKRAAMLEPIAPRGKEWRAPDSARVRDVLEVVMDTGWLAPDASVLTL